MEDAINKIEGVNEANVNFMTQKLTINADDQRFDEIMKKVVSVCKKVESDCTIVLEQWLEMSKKQKVMVTRIVLTTIIYVLLMCIEHFSVIPYNLPKIYMFILFLIPYVLIGQDILYKAILNITHGQIFDENFLMCLATFDAFGLANMWEAVFADVGVSVIAILNAIRALRIV